MSKKIIRRSNGDEVEISLLDVDRNSRIIIFEISSYNARFSFSDFSGKVDIILREIVDREMGYTTHVSRSVYLGMVSWAGAILNSSR